MDTINKKNVPNRCWTYLCSVHNVWACFAWKWLNLIPWLTTPIEAYHGLRFLLPINYNVCIEGLKPTARWSYCACFSSSSFEVNFQSCPFYSTHGEVSKLPISGSITKYDYSILLFCFGIPSVQLSLVMTMVMLISTFIMTVHVNKKTLQLDTHKRRLVDILWLHYISWLTFHFPQIPK